MVHPRTLGWLLLLLACVSPSVALEKLCADVNTADGKASGDIYQSEGKCQQTCGDKFAYAVLRSSNCWCTNYTPDEAAQKDGCDFPCPGYPMDMCGGKNRYSYLLMNADLVLGSRKGKGSSSSSSSSSSEVSSTSSTPTSTSTSTSTTDSSSSAAAEPTSSKSGPSTPPPVPSVITIDGAARTVTVVPSQPTTSTDQTTATGHGGVKLPSLLGVIFGSLGGIALLAMGVAYVTVKRKQNIDKAAFDGVSPVRAGGTGTLSKDSIDNLSDPFTDSRTSPFGLYPLRNRSGSIEYMPEKEGGLRVVNPDPDPPQKP